MGITKRGIVSNSSIQEKGLSSTNLFPGFSYYNSGSYSYNSSENKYTIVSAVTSSTWGSGVNLTTGKIHVPYKMIYRVILDVYVSTAHTVVIDINNYPESGTIQGGNDNDTNRTNTTFNIGANTWTTITFGSQNIHPNNMNGTDIIVYDGIGLRTANDASSVTWYIRNPRVYVGDSAQFTNASISATTCIAKEIHEF